MAIVNVGLQDHTTRVCTQSAPIKAAVQEDSRCVLLRGRNRFENSNLLTMDLGHGDQFYRDGQLPA